MRRFKELLRNDIGDNGGIRTQTKGNMRLSDLGAVSFGKGNTDKNQDRTPHYEINKGIEMYELNPIVNSGLNQLADFVIPNREVKISSKDKATVEFLEEWHRMRDGILDEFRNLYLTKTMTGNAYLERYYVETEEVGDSTVLDNVFSINDASRIYVNPNDVHGKTAFIFELPIGIKRFEYMGEWQTPTFYTVTYIKNYQYMFKKVWGFPLPGWKIRHYKSGWSRDNLYGRSPLISALDAHNVLNEIVSSWDTISKTRQIDQKLLTVADNETGIQVDQDRLDDLGEMLNNADSSYTLFNIPLKLIQQDITTSGNYDLMEGVFDLLRRMLISSLLPNHLTPWSDSATTQGAEASMPSLLARVKSAQNELIRFLNSGILKELFKTYPFLSTDATYVFDEPKVIDDSYYIRKVQDLINSEILTPKEARVYLMKLGILDAELFDDMAKQAGRKDEDEKPGNTKEKFPQKEVVNKESDKCCSFSEVATSQSMSFETFKKKLKEKNKDLVTTGWKEITYRSLGGHDIRLIEADSQIMLFDGLSIIETYDSKVTEKQLYMNAFNTYVNKIKDDFENFEDEESDEDRIIKELEKELKTELNKQLKDVLKLIDDHATKEEKLTEAFLDFNIISKIDNLFKNFNVNVNRAVTQAINKLGVTVTDDSSDNVVVDPQTKDMLQRKKKLMGDNIKTQIKTTKDKMLADIKSQITSGISAGQSTTDIKKVIKKSYNYDDGVSWKFNRILKTELNTASKILRLQKYKRMGFDSVKWITRGDSKVREQHRGMNKRVFAIDDLLKKISSKELNLINCRCSIIPYD